MPRELMSRLHTDLSTSDYGKRQRLRASEFSTDFSYYATHQRNLLRIRFLRGGVGYPQSCSPGHGYYGQSRLSAPVVPLRPSPGFHLPSALPTSAYLYLNHRWTQCLMPGDRHEIFGHRLPYSLVKETVKHPLRRFLRSGLSLAGCHRNAQGTCSLL